VVAHRFSQRGAGINLECFAADHPFADNLDAGIGADEMAKVPSQLEMQDYITARSSRRFDRLDHASLDALDAHLSAGFHPRICGKPTVTWNVSLQSHCALPTAKMPTPARPVPVRTTTASRIAGHA